jgi:serine/threonine-protein kinase
VSVVDDDESVRESLPDLLREFGYAVEAFSSAEEFSFSDVVLDYDFVKVLDFGIVKAAEDSVETGAALTLENVVHGTPAFIAPEQALGGSALDGRADIYATGCVAYWLLTGQLVFSAETPLSLLMHHAHTPPIPPSSRTELPIPDALDQLVLSCLAKDPAKRPQTARELSCRLAAVEGANAWTEDRARDWWVRHQPALSG